MLLRLSTLATGRTGVRAGDRAGLRRPAQRAASRPCVPEYGSLGCSGDLAPLAHCALALMGEGEVRDADGELTCPPPRRSPRPGSTPVELAEKEGLALINGTDGMLGMLVLAIADLRGAREGRRHRRGDERRGAARHRPRLRGRPAGAAPAPGPGGVSARNMTRLLAGSAIVASHRRGRHARAGRLLAALRAAGAGAVRDTLDARRARSPSASSRSAIDNPVVLPDGRVESNGNFHGAPVAYVLDFLAIAAADLASITERRTDRMLDTARSHGLPPFLADDPGVDSGHMIAQYTQAGDRERDEAARGAGERGLDPVLGDAGGPRLDGLERGAQAAPRASTASRACSRSRC